MKQFYLILLFLAFLMPASYGSEPAPRSHSLEIKKEATVYITKTGKKYHKDGCRYLSKSKIETTKQSAIKDGYGACSVCKP